MEGDLWLTVLKYPLETSINSCKEAKYLVILDLDETMRLKLV